MNIRDIEIFKELTITKNLTRASERLGLTQPTLSAWLVKLEEQLGAQLFIRSKKGLSLTDSGERLLEKSTEFSNSWKQLVQYVQTSSDAKKVVFRLGCHQTVALYSLPKILNKLLPNNSQIELSLKHDLSRHLTEDIISSRIDLGIIINPIPHPDLVIKHLGYDEVCFWSRTGDITQNTLVFDPDLKQSQTLLYELRKLDKKKTKKEKLKKEILHQLTTSSLEVAALLAAEGLGTAILPTRLAKKYPQLKCISTLPSVQDELAIVFKAGFQKSPSARILIDTIVAANI